MSDPTAYPAQRTHTPSQVWRQARPEAGNPVPALDGRHDQLAVEAPIALEYKGISHSALLATPDDLEDLAYGFSYTEGIIRQATDILDVQLAEDERGYLLQIDIANACLHQLKARRRQLAGRTGCGLCGLESLDEVRRVLPPVPPPTLGPSAEAIFQALDQIRDRQALHLLTGATHAAAWCSLEGEVLVVREDVGRHNALDKLYGHLLRQQIDVQQGMVLISSRASFEMVQKTASMGIPFLIAVSAPTSFALHIAQELGVMLAAFARHSGFTLYSHPHYMQQADSRHPTYTV